MTIASQTSRISYTGNSATTAFAVPFYFAANADLVVYLTDTAGTQTVQTLGTHYTLTGATLSAGGTCTFVTAPTTGYTVTIYRDPAMTQTTSYNNNDPFPAKSHELALDKLTTIAQRLKDLYSRAIRQTDGEATMTTTLGTVAARAGKLLGFDSTGGLIYAAGPTFTNSTFTGTAIFDTRATAAVTTIAASVNCVITLGLSAVGDGGGATYKKGTISSAGAFLDGGGTQYWGKVDAKGDYFVVDFDSRATAAATRIASNVNVITTNGLVTAGDGGGSTYVRGTIASAGAFLDGGGTQYWGSVASGSSGGGSGYSPGGRLTLTTGVAVLTSTVTGATTVYYTPSQGNVVPVYDGTNMTSQTFSEISQLTTDATKSPAAATTNSNYDIFVWLDGVTLRATRGPAWTSASARGTGAGTSELVLTKGIYLNANAITNGPAAQRGTYVGTIRTNGSSTIDYSVGGSASGGTAGNLSVWNMYNRNLATAQAIDNGTSYTYTTATVRQARASAGNQVSVVVGLTVDTITASLQTRMDTAAVAGAFATVGIGEDSTTTISSTSVYSQTPSAAVHIGSPYARLTKTPLLGYHTYYSNEVGDGSNANGFCKGSDTRLTVEVWN